MSKRLAAFALCLLALSSTLFSATNPFTDYVDWRYHPLNMHVKDTEGLSARIVDGKLRLHLREFLELVLKNSTDIQLTRLDVYTAADNITASKTPFDASLALSFSTLRSVSPLSFFTFGGSGSGTGSGTGIITSPQPGQTNVPGSSTVSTVARLSFRRPSAACRRIRAPLLLSCFPPARTSRPTFQPIEVPATAIYIRPCSAL